LNSCTYIYEPNRQVPLQSYNTFALRLISEV
jgi:hypothetical protein